MPPLLPVPDMAKGAPWIGGTIATSRDIAMSLAFLGSEASRYVNGVNLNVDMGFNAFMTTGQIDFSGLA